MMSIKEIYEEVKKNVCIAAFVSFHAQHSTPYVVGLWA